MNEDEAIQNIIHDDSNDEDVEEYFLQSTSGPYDIQERIRVANDELFEDYDPYNNAREQKVSFKEELVDYEPDFSSDDGYVRSPDVLSVISDNENEIEQNNDEDDELLLTTDDNFIEIQNNFKQSTDIGEHDICQNNCDKTNCESIDKEIHNEKDINNEVEEQIIEEFEEDIVSYCEGVEEKCNEDSEKETDEEISDEQIIEIVEIVNNSPDEEEISSLTTSELQETPTETKNEDNKQYLKTVPGKKEEKIICRLHCMEKKHLDLITGKPKNYENNLKGLALKFREKKCCTNQPFTPKLPLYNGFISEYGLTKAQLERKQRRKEKNDQKKKEKIVKIKEEKIQKDLYNEEIFRAWLKSIQTRNQAENKENKKMKLRPKTAPYCNLSLAINIPKYRRPYTSSTCSYQIILQ